MTPHNLQNTTILAGLLLGISCEGYKSDSVTTPPPDSTGGQDYERDTEVTEVPESLGEDLSQEERELYLKVQEISEKQQETDRKLEEILLHVETLKSPPQSVSLDAARRKELKEGWIEIESQKKSAIQELGSIPPGKVVKSE